MADTFVKRSALALAAFGLSMGAHAQSSVTLYGTVDAGLVYTNNQQTTLADGNTNGHANYQLAGGNLVPTPGYDPLNGLVAPDQTTFDYLRGRPAAPKAGGWEMACERGCAWKTLTYTCGDRRDRKAECTADVDANGVRGHQ